MGLVLFIALLLGAPRPQAAQGAPGDILRTFAAQVPFCSIGVGLAFDGNQLIVSCHGSKRLWGVSPVDGSSLTTYNITGSASGFGALSWDPAHQTLWACGDFSDQSSVYAINLLTRTATKKFNVVACVDGLSYDGTDNTFWASPDVSQTIYHYSFDGALLAQHNFGGQLPCGNSGIAAGGDKLFLATNGCSSIYSMNKDGSGLTFLGGYPARLEDLECDDVTFPGKAVIWSKDAYDPVLNAFDAGDIDCGVAAYKDTDADGIPDDWESNGVDINGDGQIDLDLPAMGANPNRKDLFVEIDWLTKDSRRIGPISLGGGFNAAPSLAAVSRVVNAFKNWPVPNPGDEPQGISLHLDAGPNSVMNPVTGERWGSRSRANAIRNGLRYPDWPNPKWSQIDVFRTSNVESARRGVFHYVVYVDEIGCKTILGIAYECTTGRSRGIPGHDVILAKGDRGVSNDVQEATTLAHELGHNLGLGHGGRARTDDPGSQHVNRKANYLSIMNYYYSSAGMDVTGDGKGDGALVYSSQEHDILHTGNLDEQAGLNPDPFGHFFVQYKCSNSGKAFQDSPIHAAADPWRSIDWSCDGHIGNGSSNTFLQDPAQVVAWGADPNTVLGSEDYHHLSFWGNGAGWDDRNASILDFDQPGTVEPTIDEAIRDGIWWPSRALVTPSNLELTVYAGTGTVDIPLTLKNPGDSAFEVTPRLELGVPQFSLADSQAITLPAGGMQVVALKVDTAALSAGGAYEATVDYVETDTTLGSTTVTVHVAEITSPGPQECEDARNARLAEDLPSEQVPALDAFLALCGGPPPSGTTCGEIRGDGRLSTNSLTRFVFYNVKSDGVSAPSGEISFSDRAAKPRLHFTSTVITSLVITGKHVKLEGNGVANGVPVTFVVEGDDGSPDMFSISLSNGYTASGSVAAGRGVDIKPC